MCKYKVTVADYKCHPETCNHSRHYRFIVRDGGAFVFGFDYEKELGQWMSQRGIPDWDVDVTVIKEVSNFYPPI